MLRNRDLETRTSWLHAIARACGASDRRRSGAKRGLRRWLCEFVKSCSEWTDPDWESGPLWLKHTIQKNTIQKYDWKIRFKIWNWDSGPLWLGKLYFCIVFFCHFPNPDAVRTENRDRRFGTAYFQPINQSNNQSINQSNKQSIKQSINQSNNQSIKQSIKSCSGMCSGISIAHDNN